MSEKIRIVYQSSDSFAMIAGVSILSLYENNRHITDLEVYILDAGITEKNKRKLKELAENYDRSITFVNIEKYISIIKGYKLKEYNGSCGMYMKVFLENCFEDFDRVLYLDCDVIMVNPIDELWNYDLKNKCMGMAIDCMNSKLKSGFGMLPDMRYFNTGVILFDLKKWRAQECQQIFIDFVQKNPIDYPFADQDVINISLNDKIKALPMAYNCISLYERFNCDEIKYIYDLKGKLFYPFAHYEKNRQTPVIIHFPSVYLSRPWLNNCLSGWKKQYDSYLYNDKNPWKTYRKVKPKLMLMNKIQRALFLILPHKLFIKIQKIASDYNTKRVLTNIMR